MHGAVARRSGSRPAPCRRRQPSPTTIQTRVRADLVADHPGDRRERGGLVALAREGEADVEQGEGLALALDGGHRPVAFATGEPADDDADDEEQEQVQPLRRIADRQRVDRLDEQEVVGEERADRGRDRGTGPAQDGDRDHGQQERGGRTRRRRRPPRARRRPRRRSRARDDDDEHVRHRATQASQSRWRRLSSSIPADSRAGAVMDAHPGRSAARRGSRGGTQ